LALQAAGRLATLLLRAAARKLTAGFLTWRALLQGFAQPNAYDCGKGNEYEGHCDRIAAGKIDQRGQT
jgi:hypothetical protein